MSALSWREVRRLVGRAKRIVRPRPEEAVHRRMSELAWKVGRRVPGTIDAMGLRLDYTDLVSLCPQWNDLFVRGTYDFRPGTETPRILDGGANVGLASLWWKRRFPKARITAFEADPELAACCRQNLARNGAQDVEMVEAALWTQTGTVIFHSEGSDSGAVGTVAGADLTGPRREIAAVRLRDVLEAEAGPVDLLKLDVEGAEEPLLDDCWDALGGVRALALEIHDFDPAHRRTPRVLDRLAAAGFEVRLDELHPLAERAPAPARSDFFPAWSPAWVLGVRAVRRG